MTEERKQELRRLLEDATAAENLEIRYEHARGYIYGYGLKLPVDLYKRYLKEYWTSYSIEPSWFASSVTPHIASESIHSQLLGFVREELAPIIEDDSIRSSSYVMEGAAEDSIRLMRPRGGRRDLPVLLEHLLKIAIVFGAEEAVSTFDKHSRPEGIQTHFQDIASIEGIQLEDEIPVCKGVRLVTMLGQNPERLLSRHNLHVQDFILQSNMLDHSPLGKTLLVIDRPVFSIFHRPSRKPFKDNIRVDKLPFELELEGERFTDSTAIEIFGRLFCQALSLACDCAVQIFGRGWCWAEGEFFAPRNGGVLLSRPLRPIGKSITIGSAEIDEAKRLFHILDKNSGIREKLPIPIDRWVKSKVSIDPVEKIIDLGIAFEALYVPDGDGEITFKLAVRAACHLRKNENDRRTLMKKIQEIYAWRSSVVHTGKLPKKKISKKRKIPYTEEEVASFIQKSQDLCRESILKIIYDGGFPDWDSLILGGKP